MSLLRRLLPRRQSAIERVREALAMFREEHPKAMLSVDGGLVIVKVESEAVPPDIYEHADSVELSLPNGGVRVLKYKR